VEHRHVTPARERVPALYWSLSYYEIWMEGLKRLLTEHGLRCRHQKLPVLKPQT
jgi:hypothetical protein